MKAGTHRIHRCAIDLDIARGARRALLNAFRAEPLALRHHVSWTDLEASVRAGRLRVHYMQDRPWVGFESDIAVLSQCLSHTLVRGVCVLEVQDDDGKTLRVRAEKIVGRCGETVRIPLRPRVRGQEFIVTDALEDLDALRERWPSYPRWTQNALRRKHAMTRAW